MIDNLIGLCDFIKEVSREQGMINRKILLHFPDTAVGKMFCPNCGDIRRCNVKHLLNNMLYSSGSGVDFCDAPFLFLATCLQCEENALLLLYNGPEGQLQLATIHSSYGGCITPNTPKQVKYYIDQAYRARSLGAKSAAMAMYRAALESLLYEQGFHAGMLGGKISALEASIRNNTAPNWAKSIDTEFFKAIKHIGNGAIHPNDGDIALQEKLDEDAIQLVDIVFSELLDKIYEQPKKSLENKSKLQSIASFFEH